VLGAPIILYDYPAVAEESLGSLFDSTEIDEILTLRVIAMTDAEKAEARATDPRAGDIIDRCDGYSAEDLQQLHGIFRDPHTPAMGDALEAELSDLLDGVPPEFGAVPEFGAAPVSFDTGDAPWWDPKEDASVSPGTDAVEIDGVSVARGSFVRVHPKRRSDAHDMFFADQVARVTAVVFDVDGGVHVGLVLLDDPATEMHDWYGRYFYYDPDELEPLPAGTQEEQREESRS
ncbi:MAG: hypothetical protein M3Y35_09790, partial [Actinomycetota bacterium]|nr:hypothetical protein [Actinomycetota bacterium]